MKGASTTRYLILGLIALSIPIALILLLRRDRPLPPPSMDERPSPAAADGGPAGAPLVSARPADPERAALDAEPEPVAPVAAPTAAALASATVSLEVTVLSPDGERMEGVTVRATSRGFAPGGADLLAVGSSGPDGVARLAVVPGQVAVFARADGLPVLLGDDQVRCVGPGPFSVVLVLAAAGRVRGRVTDQYSGLPVAGAAVGGPSGAEYGIAPVVTDVDGRFELTAWPIDVMAGLQVHAAGYGMEQVKLAITGDGFWEIPARYGAEALAGESGVPWVEVALVPEKVIVARLVAPLGMPSIDARAEAVGRFLTMARMAHLESREAPSNQGELRLDGLRSDITHSVRISAPGYQDQLLVAPPGILADLGAVELLPAYVVTGEVVDAAGVPVPGIRVACHSVEDEAPALTWDPLGGSLRERDGFAGLLATSQSSYTDRAGRFRVSGARTRSLKLAFGPPNAPVLEKVLERPPPGDSVDIGRFELRESAVYRCGVSLPPELLDAELDVLLATSSGTLLARVECEPGGTFAAWLPKNEAWVDVFLVDRASGALRFELRGLTLPELLAR